MPTVTIYADVDGVGHAYYGINNTANPSNERTYRLYPRESLGRQVVNALGAGPHMGGLPAGLSVLLSPAEGQVRRNDRDTHPVGSANRTTIEITQEQYDRLLENSERAVENPPAYDLNDFNCTDFTRDQLNDIGIELRDGLFPEDVLRDIQKINDRHTDVFEFIENLRNNYSKTPWDTDGNGIPDYIQRDFPASRDRFQDFLSWQPVRRDPLSLDLDGDGLEGVMKLYVDV